MMPIRARAALPLPFGSPASFAAIHFSLALKTAALQNLVHCRKRVLLPLRHLFSQFRQPCFATFAAQSTLNQPGLQQFDQAVLPMFYVLLFTFAARFKMFF